MSTNATLIGEERSSDQKEKSFDNNNITQASATTLTILSENGEGKHGLITSKTLSKDPPQPRQPYDLIAAGSATRNKSSSALNSIRALNHISDRKTYFGKHHHNNDK